MSVDHDCSPEVAAMIGSSVALATSDIPWDGPTGSVKVGRVDGELIINPTYETENKSDIDLTVAGTKEAIMMVEAGANEVPRVTCLMQSCSLMKRSSSYAYLLRKLLMKLAKRRWNT